MAAEGGNVVRRAVYIVVVEGEEAVEKRRKNTIRENRKPRTKLIKQQSP